MGSLCRAGRAGSHLPSGTVAHLPEPSDMADILVPFHVDGNSCSHSAHLPTSNDLHSQLLSVLFYDLSAAAAEHSLHAMLPMSCQQYLGFVMFTLGHIIAGGP